MTWVCVVCECVCFCHAVRCSVHWEKMNVRSDKMLENFIYPLPQTWYSHFSFVFVACCRLFFLLLFVMFCVFSSSNCTYNEVVGMSLSFIRTRTRALIYSPHNNYCYSSAPSICTTAIAHFIFAWIFDCAKQRLLCVCTFTSIYSGVVVTATQFLNSNSNIYLHWSEMDCMSSLNDDCINEMK